MNQQDTAISQNFKFFKSEKGWQCKSVLDGEIHGSWETEFQARQAMRQVFFVE